MLAVSLSAFYLYGMKKKIQVTVTILIGLISVSLGQSLPMGSTGGSRMFFRPGSYALVTELPAAPPTTIGDYYLEKEWLRGDLYLDENLKLESLYFRYNAKDNYFEIKTETEIKVLPGKRVIKFTWTNNQSEFDGAYINGALYNLEQTTVNTFLKIVSDEKYDLLVGNRFKVIPGNFNTALNVGERNDKIVKEEVLYIGTGESLMEVDSNRKKFIKDLTLFSGSDLSSFIKSNKINPKNLEDLILVTRRLNEI